MNYYTLITGATGGLGRAFVYECAKRGDNLLLSGTNLVKLDKILSDVKKDFPHVNVIAKPCDLSSEQNRIEFVTFLKENDIVINFLINNAGYIAEGEFLHHTDEEIIKTIRVNCEGTVDLTQKVIKNRNKEIPLKIITVSSMAGDYPMPYMAIYASTKAMLTSLMVALSYELKSENVFITTVCPSGIPTTDAMKDAINAQGFAGKLTMSYPEDIAKLALKASKKNKIVVVPKCINKFIKGISRMCSEKSLAKIVGKRWKKALKKRKSEGIK